MMLIFTIIPLLEAAVKVAVQIRSFEYTRQQWTGKSPKQFLNDWCRKHLQKSPPPKFVKINPRGNAFKCRLVVDLSKSLLGSFNSETVISSW